MHEETLGTYDVLVIGGGCAALSGAITAREHGASVLVLETAPKCSRAGNSRHTRNMRLAHETTIPPYTGAYPEKEMWENYLKATGGSGDLELARKVVHDSATVLAWMQEHGVRFQPAISGTLHLGRTNAWFLGGGKAMMNSLYRFAENIGVEIRYEAEVVDLDIRDRRFNGATAVMNGTRRVKVSAASVIVAAGGFQSNLEWLREAWGPPADNFLIRGAPHDTGTVLKLLLDKGAEAVGDLTQAHMVPIDARSPKFDGGIVTRLDCVTLGLVVNKSGVRFYDEGEDFWPMRYAIWGRLVARQEDQIAYALIDSKTIDRFMPSVFPAIEGGSVAEVADKLDLPVGTVVETVNEFNRAVQPGAFDHTILDGCHTEGLEPPKTNWAQRIDEPPFYGYPLRPGVTFTYFGVKVDLEASVMMEGGQKAENIFAAGEVMAGNILPKGYIGGIGLVIGNIFGRIAGEQAAALARNAQHAA